MRPCSIKDLAAMDIVVSCQGGDYTNEVRIFSSKHAKSVVTCYACAHLLPHVVANKDKLESTLKVLRANRCTRNFVQTVGTVIG
jgi:hypothetical protein